MTDSVSMEPDGYVLFENEYYTADQLDAECKTDDAARFTLAQLQAAEQKGRREALQHVATLLRRSGEVPSIAWIEDELRQRGATPR